MKIWMFIFHDYTQEKTEFKTGPRPHRLDKWTRIWADTEEEAWKFYSEDTGDHARAYAYLDYVIFNPIQGGCEICNPHSDRHPSSCPNCWEEQLYWDRLKYGPGF